MYYQCQSSVRPYRTICFSYPGFFFFFRFINYPNGVPNKNSVGVRYARLRYLQYTQRGHCV